MPYRDSFREAESDSWRTWSVRVLPRLFLGLAFIVAAIYGVYRFWK